jgi:hypothetical protein
MRNLIEVYHLISEADSPFRYIGDVNHFRQGIEDFSSWAVAAHDLLALYAHSHFRVRYDRNYILDYLCYSRMMMVEMNTSAVFVSNQVLKCNIACSLTWHWLTDEKDRVCLQAKLLD